MFVIKKYLFLFILSLISLCSYAQIPRLDWAVQLEGSSFVWNMDIAIDNDENVYAIGYFIDTVDFDPGLNISNRVSHGSDDLFLVKLDSSGNFLWINQFGGKGADQGTSLACLLYTSDAADD